MGPMNTPKPDVLIWYDSRDKRISKRFSDAYAARRFYAAKLKAGKNPKLTKAPNNDALR